MSLAFLGLASTGHAQTPDDAARREAAARRIVVQFREAAIALGRPGAVERIGTASMRQALRGVLETGGVSVVQRGMPDFTTSDTLRALPDGRILRLPDFSNLYVFTLAPGADRDAVITRLEQLPFVEYAEPDQVFVLRSQMEQTDPSAGEEYNGALVERVNQAPMPGERIPQNEPNFVNQWGLRNLNGPDIEATQAWTLTTGNPNVRIGMVDGPVADLHVDLEGKVLGGQGQGEGEAVLHGTAVASVAGAIAENVGGVVVGVDWQAPIVSRVLGSSSVETANAILSAVDAGALVINNSWGGATPSTVLNAALQSAYRAGVVLVHANPYDNTSNPAQTSDYPNNVGPWIINVGAMTSTGAPEFYTGTRSFTDVAAPGQNIYAAGAGHSPTAVWTGFGQTSAATPFVSGTASLMIGANPANLHYLRNYDVEQILRRTAQGYPTFDQRLGYGMINAYEAVRHVMAPFVVQHAPVQLTQTHTNVAWTFTSSPLAGVPAAAYYVDRYELGGTATYNFGQTPWGVWLPPTQMGFSGANPNNGLPYTSESIGANSATVRTYFYFIRRQVAGGPNINVWVPYDPTVYQCVQSYCTGAYELTVVGAPAALNPVLSGPAAVTAGTSAMWTNASTGGVPSRQSQWHYNITCPPPPCTGNLCSELDGGGDAPPASFGPPIPVEQCGVWHNGGTSSTLTKTFPAAVTTVQVRLTVSDSWSPAQSAQTTRWVTVGSGGAANLTTSAARGGDAYVTGLERVSPNPTRGTARVRFTLADDQAARVTVLDPLGREVAVLAEGHRAAGAHEVTLDGTALPTGVYVVRMEAGSYAATTRVTLVR